jgi:hypothetical protein
MKKPSKTAKAPEAAPELLLPEPSLPALDPAPEPEPTARRSPAASLPMADTIKSPPGSRLKKR